MNELPNINELIASEKQAAEQRLADKIRKIENTYLAHGLLVGEGVALSANEYELTGADWEIDVKQLPAIRRALGRLQLVNKTAVQNKRSYVWMVIAPADKAFEHLHFRYRQKLPKGAKCRIISRRYSYSSKALVCEA